MAPQSLTVTAAPVDDLVMFKQDCFQMMLEPRQWSSNVKRASYSVILENIRSKHANSGARIQNERPSWVLKIVENFSAARAQPQLPWWSSQRSPRPPSWWEGAWCPTPLSAFGLDFRPFGLASQWQIQVPLLTWIGLWRLPSPSQIRNLYDPKSDRIWVLAARDCPVVPGKHGSLRFRVIL